jgi:hypothetical protein
MRFARLSASCDPGALLLRLLNDIGKETVMADIETWINARLPA